MFWYLPRTDGGWSEDWSLWGCSPQSPPSQPLWALVTSHSILDTAHCCYHLLKEIMLIPNDLDSAAKWLISGSISIHCLSYWLCMSMLERKTLYPGLVWIQPRRMSSSFSWISATSSKAIHSATVRLARLSWDQEVGHTKLVVTDHRADHRGFPKVLTSWHYCHC